MFLQVFIAVYNQPNNTTSSNVNWRVSLVQTNSGSRNSIVGHPWNRDSSQRRRQVTGLNKKDNKKDFLVIQDLQSEV